MSQPNARLGPGRPLPETELTDLTGVPVPLVPAEGWVHLQFLRFAGCPICNLHLRQFTSQRDRIREAGIREVLVFHSSREELLKYEADLPFTTVPDPEKTWYAAFGVETSAKAIASPGVWGAVGRGIAADLKRARRGEAPLPPVLPRNGELGLPADFLIGTSGTVEASHYGRHAGDQWTVEVMLSIAGDLARPSDSGSSAG